MVTLHHRKKIVFEVSFFSNFEETIEAKFNAFVADLDLRREDRRSLLTAIMELALNAEEHSKTPDNKAIITLLFFNDHFMIRVEDKGIGLDKKKSSNKPFRGNGLKLTRALVDSLIVSDYTKGLTVTAIKNLSEDINDEL